MTSDCDDPSVNLALLEADTHSVTPVAVTV